MRTVLKYASEFLMNKLQSRSSLAMNIHTVIPKGTKEEYYSTTRDTGFIVSPIASIISIPNASLIINIRIYP